MVLHLLVNSPFKRSGEMTAHHWLNFAKIYGKYVISEYYRSEHKSDALAHPRPTNLSREFLFDMLVDEERAKAGIESNEEERVVESDNESMNGIDSDEEQKVSIPVRRPKPASAAAASSASSAVVTTAAQKADRLFKARARDLENGPKEHLPHVRVICQLLTILELCYRAHATAAMKTELDREIKEFAGKFEDWIPQTEWAIVIHNLIFHIPSTIKRWGPTRGYWCFPFER